MNTFFLYETEQIDGNGFQMFGICHLLWLIGIGIFSWWMGRFFSFAPKSRRERIRNVLGIILPVMAIGRVVVLLILGHYEPETYGLHLCNLAIWIATLYLWTRNRFAGDVFLLLCFPAAALALVFPGWLRYPFWNFMHMYSFLYHGLIVAVGWSILRSKECTPSWKSLWKPFVFGVAGYVILCPLNQWLETNFWFLNQPSGQSPLLFIYNIFGEEGYLFGHFFFCTLVVVLWTFFAQWLQGRVGEKGDTKPI